MRSKADETLVIVETLICPLQIFYFHYFGTFAKNGSPSPLVQTILNWWPITIMNHEGLTAVKGGLNLKITCVFLFFLVKENFLALLPRFYKLSILRY